MNFESATAAVSTLRGCKALTGQGLKTKRFPGWAPTPPPPTRPVGEQPNALACCARDTRRCQEPRLQKRQCCRGCNDDGHLLRCSLTASPPRFFFVSLFLKKMRGLSRALHSWQASRPLARQESCLNKPPAAGPSSPS